MPVSGQCCDHRKIENEMAVLATISVLGGSGSKMHDYYTQDYGSVE